MFFYDYTIFERNHFYDCKYIKTSFNSLPASSYVYIIIIDNDVNTELYVNQNNDFVGFELLDDAMYYIDNFLEEEIYYIERVH